jgi:DNA uptake protein ComE-like DNA-binding protein
MAKEMQMTRIADLRPYISIDVVLVGSLFYFIIRNKGKSAAESVKLKFDKDVETMWKKKFSEFVIFQSGISYFGPGKEYIISLGPPWAFLGEKADTGKHPKSFVITTEYKYLHDYIAKETATINLDEFLNTRAYPNEIAKVVENIGDAAGKHLNSLARSVEKLSKLEDIVNPTGLAISQGTLYRIAGMINEETRDKIKFDLNLSTVMELVAFLGIELNTAEKIIEKRHGANYFESFEDLKDIDGMTDEVLDRLRKRTFISTSYY